MIKRLLILAVCVLLFCVAYQFQSKTEAPSISDKDISEAEERICDAAGKPGETCQAVAELSGLQTGGKVIMVYVKSRQKKELWGMGILYTKEGVRQGRLIRPDQMKEVLAEMGVDAQG